MTTDEEVRQRIKEIIAVPQPDARIWPYNALSHNLAEWPGLFRTEAGGTHGWVIKRDPVSSDWKNAGRSRDVWIYDIWGFYGFRSGNESSNSDNEWSAIVDATRAALKAAPTLDELAEIERHELLQVVQNTTIDCGEETLHLSRCRLTVRLCC